MRDYDTTPYRKERARWRIIINNQGAVCVRCHRPIHIGAAFDLDHTEDRAGILGPSHPACNRGAGGRKARAKERARITRRSHVW